MREVPERMTRVWRSGQYIGSDRPFARVTVQHPNIELHELGYNTYSTLPFGAVAVPGAGCRQVSLSGYKGNELQLTITLPNGQTYTESHVNGPIQPPADLGEFNASQIGQFTLTLVDKTRNQSWTFAGNAKSNDRVRIGPISGNGYTGFRYSWDDAGSGTSRDSDFNDYVHEIRFYVPGGGQVPKELPNVKSVSWNRSVDQDFASCTVTFYNTAPLEMGMLPSRDLDQPGYYTFNRGRTSYSTRWQQAENEWANMLMPDNLLRTYEGYGFDSSVAPEKDSNLVQTGVWRIDEVEYTHTGLITVTCRDIGSILADQIIFPPVAPENFWPVTFTRKDMGTGMKQGYTYATEQSTKRFSFPAGYFGPKETPVGQFGVQAGNGTLKAIWDQYTGYAGGYANPADPTQVETWRFDGWFPWVNGVIVGDYIPFVEGKNEYSFDFAPYNPINGNHYVASLQGVWREEKSGKRQLVEPLEAGSPGGMKKGAPRAVATEVDQVLINTGPIPADPLKPRLPEPGSVGFRWFLRGAPAPTHFGIIVIGADGAPVVFQTTYAEAMASNEHGPSDLDPKWGYFQTGMDLTGKSVLVFPVGAAGAGIGEMYMQNNLYYRSFSSSGLPSLPPPIPQGTVTVTTPSGTTVPVSRERVPLTLIDTSCGAWRNYKASQRINTSFHVDEPGKAIDDNVDTYWLSPPHDSASSFEYMEFSLPNVTLSSVRLRTYGKNYTVYISVWADGEWKVKPTYSQIPYVPEATFYHSGADIPYLEYMNTGDTEGPLEIFLETAIRNATKLRVTFGNLAHLTSRVTNPSTPWDGQRTKQYHAGVREVAAYVLQGENTEQPTPAPTVTPAVPGAITNIGGQSGVVQQDGSVYVPPRIQTGAGDHPGYYEDYTDIVKMFCAWGGFFWPRTAVELHSDGTERRYEWGPGLYGLENVDPVLGEDAGRVWGDFQQTGTAGVAGLDVAIWDKKSLMDGISYVRDIVGFIFYIDEQGAITWRMPNIFKVGNYIGNLGQKAGYTQEMIVIDEQVTLMGLRVRLSGANIRERVFIASTDGTKGGITFGYNPNKIGLRRVGGWTDQNFASNEECQVMADFIALRQLFTYRTDSVTIPGYPAIQIDDQVKIFEQVTSEGYIHYVKGIASNLDLETGDYTYELETHWLGERPFDLWVFNPDELSEETQRYLQLTGHTGTPSGTSGSSTVVTSSVAETDAALFSFRA